MVLTGETAPFDPSQPLETEGYVCPSRGAKLQLQKVMLPPMTATTVQVDLDTCGLCHTDIHMRDNDWGIADFPLLAGHEGVGVVSAIGSSVHNVRIGDRVGLGWIRDSCRDCPPCRTGRENLCRAGYQGLFLGPAADEWGDAPERYHLHGGCFSRVQRVQQHMVVRIPQNVAPALASPLLCGGGTMFEPLVEYARAGDTVGVVGVGGLGTCGIQLAKLRGCRVVAVSRSEGKRARAMQAGADEFWSVEAGLEGHKHKLDLVIDTRPTNGGSFEDLLDLLRYGGKLCRVGIPREVDELVTVSLHTLVFESKGVVATAVTGSARMADMMQLVSDNVDKVTMTGDWKAQVVPMSDINWAMDKLEKGQNAGFRYVLKW